MLEPKPIYIASSLKNYERVLQIKNSLRKDYNIKLTYDWTPHAKDVLTGNQEREEEALRHIAYNEFRAVINASLVFVIMPGRNGTHFEYGMAYALKKPIVYLDDQDLPVEQRRFEPIHFLENVHYLDNEEDAIKLVGWMVAASGQHPMDMLTKG